MRTLPGEVRELRNGDLRRVGIRGYLSEAIITEAISVRLSSLSPCVDIVVRLDAGTPTAYLDVEIHASCGVLTTEEAGGPEKKTSCIQLKGHHFLIFNYITEPLNMLERSTFLSPEYMFSSAVTTGY